ncbi:MAG: hypothetical protein NVSMB48_15830 [Marmoricola sp.]
MTITTQETTSNAVVRKFLRPDELALRWSVAPKTLAKWRCEGTGPHFIKLSNGIVRYPMADIETFELAAAEG